MARDATARLYDVEDSSVVYKKPGKRGRYDHGTIAFNARKGKLVDLDKLHESVWATRLSGGTSSGLVKLDVRVLGNVVIEDGQAVMKVAGSKSEFVLADDPSVKVALGQKTVLQQIRDSIATGKPVVNVTGQVQGWNGHWPKFLAQRAPSPHRLLVTSFE
ncbi:MAG: hypothetical protein O3A00_20455 [Planctomycetota bacterium]|nr:hypothetical protein [Planctomycetota bacterium]